MVKFGTVFIHVEFTNLRGKCNVIGIFFILLPIVLLFVASHCKREREREKESEVILLRLFGTTLLVYSLILLLHR